MLKKIISLIKPKLLMAPVLVFFMGVPLIISTRIIFYIYHPEYFINRLPSISKTAAYTPGSYLFYPGMTFVSLCILVTWTYIYQLNKDRISHFSTDDNNHLLLHLTNSLATILGVSAGIFLGFLSIISLETDDPLHILLSILFFSCLILSFIFDTLCVFKIKEVSALNDIKIGNLSLNGKPYICVIITLTASFFLFMYLAKDSTIFSDRYFAQQLYIAAEYSTALLAFSYSALYSPEINNHFSKTKNVNNNVDILDNSTNYI